MKPSIILSHYTSSPVGLDDVINLTIARHRYESMKLALSEVRRLLNQISGGENEPASYSYTREEVVAAIDVWMSR